MGTGIVASGEDHYVSVPSVWHAEEALVYSDHSSEAAASTFVWL